MSTCRSCDAEVVFVPSATSGRPMILDAQPRKGVVLRYDDVGEYGMRHDDETVPRQGALVADVLNIYTDHHATCPNAADWKRPSKVVVPLTNRP